jgi:hypothetical protein
LVHQSGKDKDNWQCIKDQTLPNTHVWKFLSKIELISALCIVDPVRRADWNTSIYSCNEVIAFARKRDTFDDDEVEDIGTPASLINLVHLRHTYS